MVVGLGHHDHSAAIQRESMVAGRSVEVPDATERGREDEFDVSTREVAFRETVEGVIGEVHGGSQDG